MSRLGNIINRKAKVTWFCYGGGDDILSKSPTGWFLTMEAIKMYAIIHNTNLKAISAICQITLSSLCCVQLPQLKTFSCLLILHLLVWVPPHILGKVLNPGPFVQSSEPFLGFVKLCSYKAGNTWRSIACNPFSIAVVICCLIFMEMILSLASPPVLSPHPLTIAPAVLVKEEKIGRWWVDRGDGTQQNFMFLRHSQYLKHPKSHKANRCVTLVVVLLSTVEGWMNYWRVRGRGQYARPPTMREEPGPRKSP